MKIGPNEVKCKPTIESKKVQVTVYNTSPTVKIVLVAAV